MISIVHVLTGQLRYNSPTLAALNPITHQNAYLGELSHLLLRTVLNTNWPVFTAAFYSKSNELLGYLSLQVKSTKLLDLQR